MEAKGRAQGGESAHRFYISSPFLGLKKEREEAKQRIMRRNHAYGDSYGGSSDPLVETCQRDVRASDHYVLILGERYGTRRAEHGGKSVTELEFEAALEAGLSLHAFFLGFVSDSRNGIERDSEAQTALAAFRRRVSDRCVPVECGDQEDGRSGWQVFSEAITALAANPPPKPGEGSPAVGASRPVYTPQALQSWVERHHPGLSAAFLGLASVQARQVHVPLDVALFPAGARAMEGPRLLTPDDLAPLLATGGDHVLLLSADGGAGKTSLAFAIARWLLAGEPGGVVRLPVLLETALAPGETVAGRVRSWLRAQLAGVGEEELAEELVMALLAAKRLVPIIDHLSELAPAAREHLLGALPPGVVIVTSRAGDDGFRERPLSRLLPQRIALERLQAFFVDYLRRKGEQGALTDDDLMPAQAQLKRIVGDKPITVLLAQMFIDDVIANRQEGLLAGSVPELMLNYVRRLDTPDRPEQRRRAGLLITEDVVQRALRVVALRSHEQAPLGLPLYQPLEFAESLAREALMEEEPEGLGLTAEHGRAVVAYLMAMRLLVQPGVGAGRLRLPLDPLADYLAAAEQLERLEQRATRVSSTTPAAGQAVWEAFVAGLEARSEEERERMRGFLLALRDGALGAMVARRALVMPAAMPDRLARLGLLDPELERYRLAVQRARKWMWELRASVAAERRDAIGKLAAMAAKTAEPSDQRAVRDVAAPRLAQALLTGELPEEERQEAAVVLALMASPEALSALDRLAGDGRQPVALRRRALEALGLAARGLGGAEGGKERERLLAVLNGHLRAEPLDLLIQNEAGWRDHDARLPLLQGASRGVQLAASADLPLLGSGPGLAVPMLTLTALAEAGGLRVRTEVVEVPVWKLPLPALPGSESRQLELVMVPAGRHQLGSPPTEWGREEVSNWFAANRDGCQDVDVEALRQVRLEGFALVRHPISQGQWRVVVEAVGKIERELDPAPGKATPESLWDHHGQPGDLAVDSVSWHDCQEWLKRLNSWLAERWPELGGSGEAPQLALPSESQWEAACRGPEADGASRAFHFGDTLDGSWARYNSSVVFGPGRASTVARVKQPGTNGASGLVNRLGLAEMHGQLFEWCEDSWHPNPIGQGWPADGLPWRGEAADLVERGSGQRGWKLLRGGSWINDPVNARAAVRYSSHPGNLDPNVGVRPGCFSPPGSLLGA